MLPVERTLSIELRDSLFDPDSSERTAQYRPGSAGKPEYRVYLYLDGPDLPFVEEVVYQLHETFSPSTRRVTRSVSNQRCKMVIWTWGIFPVRAAITSKVGSQLTLTHRLGYGQQI